MAEEQKLDSVQFIRTEVTDLHLDPTFTDDSRMICCAYARFFLHAITDAAQDQLFDILARDLRAGDMVALEFRTFEDQDQHKVATPHFRRFQSAEYVDNALAKRGFEKTYGAQGVGFAKYFEEDAFVARGVYRLVGRGSAGAKNE